MPCRSWARAAFRNSTTAICAESAPPEPQPWQRLLASLRRGRMGRIVVRSVLFCDGTRVGAFDGEFAVIPS